MLTGLNLSLCSGCSANCVFCPLDRGVFDRGVMSVPMVQLILEQAQAFKDSLRTVQLGENGDALLNPEFLRIVRLIRYGLPQVKIHMSCNMARMTDDIARCLLEEQLLDSLQMNVDGHDAFTYEMQKRVSYEVVMKNLRDFIKVREQYHSSFPFSINVIPLTDYVNAIRRKFNRNPLNFPVGEAPFSSYEKVKDSLNWLPSSVPVLKAVIFAWAERNQPLKIDPSHYSCPQMPRVEKEAFISPSGWWYPCCLDANQDQRYGNIADESLETLFHSEKRQTFIQRLRDRKYTEVGYPCNRVPFCMVIG